MHGTQTASTQRQGRTDSPTERCTKVLSRLLTEEDFQVARKHRNVLLNLSSYREMQISTTARDSGHPSKQLQFLGCGQEAGQPGLCRSAGACRGHRSLEGGLTVSTGEHTRAPRPRNSSPMYTAKRRARVCPARDPCQNVPRGSVRSSPHPGASPGTSNSKMGKHAVVGGGRAAGRTSSSRASQPDTEPRSRTPALPRYNLTYTQPKTAHLLLRRRAVIGEGAARGTGGRQGSGLGAGCAQGVGCVLGTCRFPESATSGDNKVTQSERLKQPSPRTPVDTRSLWQRSTAGAFLRGSGEHPRMQG